MGIVEPRVVVKIPWTKIGRKTLPQENSAITKQMHIAPDATNAIKAVYQIADDVSITGATHSVKGVQRVQMLYRYFGKCTIEITLMIEIKNFAAIAVV